MQEYRKKVCVQGLQNFFTSKLAGERGGLEIVGTDLYGHLEKRMKYKNIQWSTKDSCTLIGEVTDIFSLQRSHSSTSD